MGQELDRLGETILKGVEYLNKEHIRVNIVDSNEKTVTIIFRDIFHFSLSFARGAFDKDNEIWKIEEVLESSWIRGIFTESGVHWKEQVIADKYHRVKSIPNPDELHHFVLFSDYVDLEVICVDYVVVQDDEG